jgi:hypothetical protein
MKKIKKILLISFILLFALGLVAVVLAGIFLDKIVKTGIETVAPGITQTTVTLDAVHISALTGSVGVHGLIVGNPEGYQTPQSISIGHATVSVAPGSLLADKIIIRSLEVQAPEITFEGNPFGDNNLKKIMANVDSGAAATDQAVANAPAPTGKPAKSKGAAKKLEVDEFLISGIKINARLSGISHIPGLAGRTFTVPIPDIHFTQLGTGPDGITAADLTRKVLQQVLTETIKAVGDYAKNLAGDATGGLLKGASSSMDTVKKSLGGLFGK